MKRGLSYFTGAMFLMFLPGLVPVAEAAGEPIPHTGDVLQWLIPATGFGATYLYDDSEGRWRQFLPSMATALGVTTGLKYAVNEQRPNGGSQSFPSGHTSSAFQGATFLQQRYGWEWGIPAYAGAIYTGWSRVELRAHYPHDVYAGAAIGILSSYIFTTRYSKDVQLAAFAENGAIGVRVGFAW